MSELKRSSEIEHVPNRAKGEVERMPSWIINECDRWRVAQMRSGHFPGKSELEAYRRQLAEAGEG